MDKFDCFFIVFNVSKFREEEKKVNTIFLYFSRFFLSFPEFGRFCRGFLSY